MGAKKAIDLAGRRMRGLHSAHLFMKEEEMLYNSVRIHWMRDERTSLI